MPCGHRDADMSLQTAVPQDKGGEVVSLLLAGCEIAHVLQQTTRAPSTTSSSSLSVKSGKPVNQTWYTLPMAPRPDTIPAIGLVNVQSSV